MVDKQRQGRSNKRKGYYYESKAVQLAHAAGLDAKRQWGSGRVPSLPDDLIIEGEQYEVKSRATGFAFDEILDDESITGLITFSTAKRGLAPLIRLRYTNYLALKEALKAYKVVVESLEKSNSKWSANAQALEAQLGKLESVQEDNDQLHAAIDYYKGNDEASQKELITCKNKLWDVQEITDRLRRQLNDS